MKSSDLTIKCAVFIEQIWIYCVNCEKFWCNFSDAQKFTSRETRRMQKKQRREKKKLFCGCLSNWKIEKILAIDRIDFIWVFGIYRFKIHNDDKKTSLISASGFFSLDIYPTVELHYIFNICHLFCNNMWVCHTLYTNILRAISNTDWIEHHQQQRIQLLE